MYIHKEEARMCVLIIIIINKRKRNEKDVVINDIRVIVVLFVCVFVVVATFTAINFPL